MREDVYLKEFEYGNLSGAVCFTAASDCQFSAALCTEFMIIL
jgi:hypothetical protein